MDRNKYLDKIITEFEDYWIKFNSKRSAKRDFYKDTITDSYLTSLSENDFIEFFYGFVSDGGGVQTGGARTKNIFRKTIRSDFNSFKQFVLTPFQSNFSPEELKDWFLKLDNFRGFGVGIATIFLNWIDYSKYPIMNNKTVKALNKLGYKISSSKNWTNYELVKKHQDHLIKNYPSLKNYYKADLLNHFLLTVYEGQELMRDYKQIETFENGLEQQEIERTDRSVETDSGEPDKDDLYQKIIDCENDKSEEITRNGKVYKRHNYLMVQIKKYRGKECQFCSTKICKSNGVDYYIEACHIKAKSEGGEDRLNNILILCPNCHKLFDYGKKEEKKHTKDSYSVVLNGKTYEALLK